jgi:peptide/nickel transport system permease protein
MSVSTTHADTRRGTIPSRDAILALLPAPTVLAAFGFLAFLVLAALVPGMVTGGDPYGIAPRDAFQAPGWAHPFGTDPSGRDIFTRIVYGARQSLLVGVGAVAISVTGAILLGLLGGLSGPWLRRAVSALLDVMFSFPALILALLFAAVFGHGVAPLTIASGARAMSRRRGRWAMRRSASSGGT